MKKPPAHSTHSDVGAALREILRIIDWWLTKGSGR